MCRLLNGKQETEAGSGKCQIRNVEGALESLAEGMCELWGGGYYSMTLRRPEKENMEGYVHACVQVQGGWRKIYAVALGLFSAVQRGSHS